MVVPLHHHFRFPVAGLLAAVLALVSQLALGALVLPDDPAADQLSALDALTILCQGDAPAPASDGLPAPHPHPHRDAGSLLAPLSVALALPAVILGAAPSLPPPAAMCTLGGVATRGARGAPCRRDGIAYPRGPPILI